MRVAEALGRALAALGTRHLFGLVGSGNLELSQAAVAAGARFVAARQETAAVAMADAYARLSGRPGVATVHQGPGITNALTGLTEAAKSRTPVVLLAADTSASAVHSNFRLPAAQLATALGAATERLDSPATAVPVLAGALQRAQAERRAVLVLAPLDVQGAECPDPVLPGGPKEAGGAPSGPCPSPEEVSALADLLAGADRPLLLAGRGAVLAGAGPVLESLAEVAGAYLATSAMAHGLFRGNPRSLGIAGGFASPPAARLMAGADAIVAFGASLNMWTTRHGALIGPRSRVAQVDVEPSALGAHRPVDLAVVGDAAETARAVAAALTGNPASAGGRVERVAGWADQSYEDRSEARWIDPRTLTLALDRLVPSARTVVVDSGHFMGWPAMYLRVPDQAGFVFAQAFQSVGLGLAGAAGAALARPDRLTLACVGDGGALMALGELETLARLGLPVMVVVYNDAAYGAEVHHFAPKGLPTDLAVFPPTDLAGVARALGAEGVTVRRVEDLGEVEAWLGRRDGPLVVDAKVNPAVVGEWLEEAFRAH